MLLLLLICVSASPPPPPLFILLLSCLFSSSASARGVSGHETSLGHIAIGRLRTRARDEALDWEILGDRPGQLQHVPEEGDAGAGARVGSPGHGGWRRALDRTERGVPDARAIVNGGPRGRGEQRVLSAAAHE
eukprot:213132-Heterocapsa_arctica.AAC.1